MVFATTVKSLVSQIIIIMTEPPSYFVCPITEEVMIYPVILADGNSYEREAIETWFSMGKRTSPKTNSMVDVTQVTPNHNLRQAIQEWLRDNPQAELPSPKRLKHSSIPEFVPRRIPDLRSRLGFAVEISDDQIIRLTKTSQDYIPWVAYVNSEQYFENVEKAMVKARSGLVNFNQRRFEWFNGSTVDIREYDNDILRLLKTEIKAGAHFVWTPQSVALVMPNAGYCFCGKTILKIETILERGYV